MWQRLDVNRKPEMFTVQPFTERVCWPLVSVVILNVKTKELMAIFFHTCIKKENQINTFADFVAKKTTEIYKFCMWWLPFCFSYLGLDVAEQCIACLAYVDFHQLVVLLCNVTCLTSK